MSILVQIAEKADVSVEGVVRVLTREPVSDAVKERVLAVLDDLDPDETRAVQRFALAALHDVLGRPGDPVEALPPAVSPDQLELELPSPASDEPALLAATGSDAALVQLSSVLGDLAEAVRDLRRETDAERRERVDDLAVLIDLITTGWQGLDGRLGRLERQLGRLQPGPQDAPPPRITPVPAPVEQAAAGLPVPASTPASPESSPSVTDAARRDRLPLAAALTLVGIVIGVVAVLQLFSNGPDVTGIVAARDTPTATAARVTTGAIPTAPARTRPAATGPRPTTTGRAASRPPTTSSVLGTTVTATRPRSTAPQAAPRPATTAPATTAAEPAGFRPTRSWAWAPVAGADYYDVEFSRGGASFYRASPTEARLTLPGSVTFRPGSYRWVVRPGFGERSAGKLGPPVVDSPFTVTG